VYFEIGASVKVTKPTSGWKANAYVIFDYYSPTDFKFAGLDQSMNKIVMGHRTAAGWIVDVQAAVGNVVAGRYYALLVSVNGIFVTVSLDGRARLTYQFPARWVDGVARGFNTGLVGVGSDNSRGVFDNVVVQTIPPQTTFDTRWDFESGMPAAFAGTGAWAAVGGTLSGIGSSPAMSIIDLPARAVGGTTTTLESVVNLAAGASGGYFIDGYGDRDYKMVRLDQATGTVVLAHRVRNRTVVDATFAAPLAAGVDHSLVVTLFGTTVTVSLDGVTIGSFSYNGAVADGQVGLLAWTGSSAFDDLHVTYGVPLTFSPDPIAPTLTVPPPITRSTADGADTVYISDASLGTATAVDNVAGVTVTRVGVPAGNLFTVGVTTITWIATDAFGNTTTGSQVVTVLSSLPVVSVAASDPAGAERGSDPLVFTVTRSGSTAAALEVQLNVGGTASASDYVVSVTGGTYSGGVLTVAAGVSTAVLTVRPVDDSAVEPTESVVLTVLAGDAYSRGPSTSASGSVSDDDDDAPPPPMPALTVQGSTVTEGAGGVTIVVSLSAPAPAGGVTVRVSTANGSAGGSDFSSISQLVTIPAGATSATVRITIKIDKKSEPTEYFTVSLSSPTGATIAVGTATVTILDDDGKAAATLQVESGGEGADAATSPVLADETSRRTVTGAVSVAETLTGVTAAALITTAFITAAFITAAFITAAFITAAFITAALITTALITTALITTVQVVRIVGTPTGGSLGALPLALALLLALAFALATRLPGRVRRG